MSVNEWKRKFQYFEDLIPKSVLILNVHTPDVVSIHYLIIPGQNYTYVNVLLVLLVDVLQ